MDLSRNAHSLSPSLAASLLITLVASASSARAQEYFLTASGSYQSFTSDGITFDGTNTGTLAPLLDVNRLNGGRFTATFRFSVVGAPPSGAFGSYTLSAPAGINYELFDPSGSLVHRGTAPSQAGALVFNNSVGTTTSDGVTLSSFVDAVTGLTPPAAIYSPSGELGAVTSAFVFSGDVGPGTDFINDLSIPTFAASYLMFPNRTFRTGAFFGDGDWLDQAGPFQYVETSVQYSVNSLTITPIPAPGVAAVLGLAGLFAFRRQR